MHRFQISRKVRFFASVQPLESRLFLSSSPQLVQDIRPGTGSSSPLNGFSYQNQLFFSANDGVHSSELWKSDGTAAGTSMVHDTNPTGGSGPSWHAELNGILYFSIDDGINGSELWRTDGTDAGTSLVRNINPTATGSFPSNLVAFNGQLFFTANDGTGIALWKSDGTTSGTVKVRGGITISDGLNALVPCNGKLFFYANDVFNGWELWSSDGTTAGTSMVTNIGPSDSISLPQQVAPVSFNGAVYFAATDGSHGAELWKSDGTAAGTIMVRDIVSGSGSSLISAPLMTVVGQTLYFRANDGMAGLELWKSNGMELGTTLVADVLPGSAGSSPGSLTAAENSLYFVADDGVHGSEIWRSDGTANGTALTRDIRVGSASSSMFFLHTSVGDKLYFSANDGLNGEEVWQTDGTETGTFMLADIWSGGFGAITGPVGVFAQAGDMLFFTARESTHGSELWSYPVVDHTPPQIIEANYRADGRTIDLLFDEAISQTVIAADFGVTDLLTGTSFQGAIATATFPDAQSLRLTLATTLDDANYELSIPAASVKDLSGNGVVATTFSDANDSASDFFCLNADANRDRRVDTNDFNLLAGNFGGASKVFSQGNFDYDPAGNVDSVDFGIFVGQYGKSLPPPSPEWVSIPSSGRSVTSVSASRTSNPVPTPILFSDSARRVSKEWLELL